MGSPEQGIEAAEEGIDAAEGGIDAAERGIDEKGADFGVGERKSR